MPSTAYDYTVSGCKASTSGAHAIQWIAVPAMTYDGSFTAGYDAHERGFCWDCDQRFTR